MSLHPFDAGTEMGMKRAYAQIVGDRSKPIGLPACSVRFFCPYCEEWRTLLGFTGEGTYDPAAILLIAEGGSAHRECPGCHKMLALVASPEQQRKGEPA